MSRKLLAFTLAAFFLTSLTLAFAGRKKERTPEDICTSRQVTVYDGCMTNTGNESYCWQYATSKYNECMRDQAHNKRLKESQATVGGATDRPTIQTSKPTPLPLKPVDKGQLQQGMNVGDRKALTGGRTSDVGGRSSTQSKPSPSPSPRK